MSNGNPVVASRQPGSIGLSDGGALAGGIAKLSFGGSQENELPYLLFDQIFEGGALPSHLFFGRPLPTESHRRSKKASWRS